jgi:hypothetical protein
MRQVYVVTHIALLCLALLALAGCKVDSVDNAMQGSIGRGYSFSLEDPTAVAGHAKQQTINVIIETQDVSIAKWCISETQTTQPADTSICSGSSWRSSKPTTFTLSNGGGTKTVYLWAANGNGAVKKGKITSYSIYLESPPQIAWVTPAATVYQSGVNYTFQWSATDAGGPGLLAVNTYLVEYFTVGSCAGAPTTTTNQNVAANTLAKAGLAEGIYSVRITAFDTDGVASSASCSPNLYVDTTVPVVNITANPPNPDNSNSPSFSFTATDGGPSGATVHCFDGVTDLGVCTSPFSFTAADGNHTFKVVMTDNAGNSGQATYSWNINTLVITQTVASVQYQAQAGSAWTKDFTVTGGTGAANFTYSLPVNGAGGVASGNTTSTANISVAALGAAAQYNITLRVTDSGSGNTKDFLLTLDSYAAGVCVWNGKTSTTWATASNWDYCGGVAPIATNDIAIYALAPNMPDMIANTTVNSFGVGPGGGTIKVFAGKSLTITSATLSFRSSVQLKGDTTTCTTCSVINSALSTDLTITNGATLTLLNGITLRSGFGGTNHLNVGDGLTGGGNLIAGNGGATNTWPNLGGGSFFNLVVSGINGQKSVIKFNGVNITQAVSTPAVINFVNYYDIQQFDSVSFKGAAIAPSSGMSYMKFTNCSNALGLGLGTIWNNLFFEQAVTTSGNNIWFAGVGCNGAGIGPININAAAGTNGGWGYGSIYANDVTPKLIWANSTTFTCTWTGAGGTGWLTPGSWSGCVNGRGNYPDQLDNVIIPVTGTQPVVSVLSVIRGFAAATPAASGGVVTITNAAGTMLQLQDTTNTIQSDVQFKGNTLACTACYLRGANDLEITNGATVTLLNGITVVVTSSAYSIKVGNGTTSHGILIAGNGGIAANWPNLGTNASYWVKTIVSGGATPSIIKFNGVHVGSYGANPALLTFNRNFDIQQFDNVEFSVTPTGNPSTNQMYVSFSDCTNGNVSGLGGTWNGISFVNALVSTANNINITAANCAGLNPITLNGDATTYGGLAYGGIYSKDTAGHLTWTNSATNTCRWTGALGAGNLNWNAAGNWDDGAGGACNTRGGFPDQLDLAVIPQVATQPTVSAYGAIRGFAVAAAPPASGGTVTVAAGKYLLLTDQTQAIRSSVTLQGTPTTCTTCTVYGAGIVTITDGATLTLGHGIMFRPVLNTLNVGNVAGTSSGNLMTLPAGLPTENPYIGCSAGCWSNVVVTGTAAQKSIVKVNGINFSSYGITGSAIVNFMDYSDLQQFDNTNFAVAMAPNAPNGTLSYLKFSNCTNSTITPTWNNISFNYTPLATGYNVDYGPASCTTAIDIFGATGYCTGAACAAKAKDPIPKLTWH